MKSQHRHELQANDLSKLANRMGEFFEQYGQRVVLALVGVVAIVGGGVYWMRLSHDTLQAGWTELQGSSTAEEFANVADNYPKTAVAAWARLKEAEQNLEIGIRSSFSDRQGAESDLNQAQKQFDELVKDPEVPAAVRQRSLFGLGRCLETTGGGDTGPAIEAYSRLMTEFPKSILADLAKQRVQSLETGDAQAFYAWFQKQNPKPPDRQLPRDGRVPGQPEIPAEFTPDDGLNTNDETSATPSPAVSPTSSEAGADSPKSPEADQQPKAADPEASPGTDSPSSPEGGSPNADAAGPKTEGDGSQPSPE